jgi:hypothetical protein
MIRTALIAACLAMACNTRISTESLAGGLDDFDPANDDTAVQGPVYFGFVRDVRGAQVASAQVVLRQKNGAPAIIIPTNELGLYRGHVAKDVIPDDVEISCEKSGYKQTQMYRRTPPGAKSMYIETDCTLQALK